MKYIAKISYRIYKVDSKGMLEEPKDSWDQKTYDNYKTEEEALLAIQNEYDYDCIILKVVNSHPDYE